MRRELEDIVFTKVDSRWVHHPHFNALVITSQIANSNVHQLMVDDGSAVEILNLNVYKMMGLAEGDLNPITSPIYEFMGDHVVPKGTVKLTITVGEHSRTSMVIGNFLVVDCLSAINGIIGRPLLKALKVVTSIYHLTIKFPTAKGTCEVQEN